HARLVARELEAVFQQRLHLPGTSDGTRPGFSVGAAASAELQRLPGLAEAPLQLRPDLLGRQAELLERVAVAAGHRAVLHRLVVDGDAPRRADLVLAAVALADRAARVVLGRHPLAQVLVDRPRPLRLAVLVDEREHRDLDRR